MAHLVVELAESKILGISKPFNNVQAQHITAICIFFGWVLSEKKLTR
jgi:hypothetical protein